MWSSQSSLLLPNSHWYNRYNPTAKMHLRDFHSRILLLNLSTYCQIWTCWIAWQRSTFTWSSPSPPPTACLTPPWTPPAGLPSFSTSSRSQTSQTLSAPQQLVCVAPVIQRWVISGTPSTILPLKHYYGNPFKLKDVDLIKLVLMLIWP